MELDPLRLPLRGARLIEAGAGTGKTWSIAALYVRLVLGHGGEAAFARPLVPPEILVVTFTEAATEELRARIRVRLAEAAAAFRAVSFPADDFLAALRAGHERDAWPECALRLERAAEWMDEAAISTIHAWCQRMLHEHAFDSGSLFEQRLEAERGELLAEVTRDYWRIFLAPLEFDAATEVAAWWPEPERLAATLERLLEDAGELAEAPAPAESLTIASAERKRMLAELKAPWPAWVDALQRLFDDAVADKGRIDGKKLQKRYYQAWLDALRAWAADPQAREPRLSDSAWARLSPAGLAEAWKRGDPPDHPALAALAELPARLAALPDAREAILCHAGRWVAARFKAEQTRLARMGFDDLLTRLAAALAGARGEALAGRIRARFPAALIDEFQDTDPVQYAIFERVYRPREDRPETALVLIGDPKQAIYAFRGADIHTYLAARRDCAGRIHTLRHNYRSSAAMVRAVNHCFGRAEARPEGAGAFLFRAGDDNPLPFVAAMPQGRPGRLRLDGEDAVALRLWWLASLDGKAISQEEYRDRMAAACAGEIARLLGLGASGRAGIEAADGGFSPLRPGDIAVLVNERREAAAVRAALAARGVPSVYLSERDSVYQSPQAADLQRCLLACAEPEDPARLHAALASASLGLDWAELDRLRHDESFREAALARFQGYREIWRRQGVLPMLRRLLHDHGVAARLLARPDGSGERALTDLMHLAELMQTAAAELDGEHALIRHLAEARRQEDAGGECAGRRQRLESDADRVRVITVHKSKGLEYPLVFLPYAARARPLKERDFPRRAPDADGRRRLWLRAEPDVLARAERERLGEDLRKLYVALTRARHATWVGLAGLADLDRAAIGHLLAEGGVGPGDLEAALRELAQACPDIAATEAPEVGASACFSTPAASLPRGAARWPTRVAAEPWWIASYSALRTRVEEGPRPAPETAAESTFREDRAGAGPVLASGARQVADVGGPHVFPRGAEVGTFLHEWLEWAAGQGFGALAGDPARIHASLLQRCIRRGWEGWTPLLARWATDLLRRPFALPGTEFSLAGLGGVVAEMEFWIAAGAVDSVWLDRQVSDCTLSALPRPELAPERIQGMLKGFIDLVFEWRGRYYVADYKSNWLGPDDTAYAPEHLRQAVLDARYDLQYSLYLLALHRLLRARLPDYDYDRHVGGAVYLFLRGVAAPGGGVHFERPPRILIDALDRQFAGES